MFNKSTHFHGTSYFVYGHDQRPGSCECWNAWADASLWPSVNFCELESWIWACMFDRNKQQHVPRKSHIIKNIVAVKKGALCCSWKKKNFKEETSQKNVICFHILRSLGRCKNTLSGFRLSYCTPAKQNLFWTKSEILSAHWVVITTRSWLGGVLWTVLQILHTS